MDILGTDSKVVLVFSLKVLKVKAGVRLVEGERMRSRNLVLQQVSKPIKYCHNHII